MCVCVFCFLSKADVRPDGKIACTLRVYWGEFEGKGANIKIAKTTVAKLAMEALEQRTSRE